MWICYQLPELTKINLHTIFLLFKELMLNNENDWYENVISLQIILLHISLWNIGIFLRERSTFVTIEWFVCLSLLLIMIKTQCWTVCFSIIFPNCSLCATSYFCVNHGNIVELMPSSFVIVEYIDKSYTQFIKAKESSCVSTAHFLSICSVLIKQKTVLFHIFQRKCLFVVIH